MTKRKMAIALAIGLTVATTSPAIAQGQTTTEPNWESLPVEMLDQYAALYRINLGAAKSKEAKIAVLRDAWKEFAYVAGTVSPAAPPASNGSISLPPADLLRPRLPDLSQASVPGRALNVLLLLLGAFGVAVIVFGTLHFLVLAGQAFSGRLSRGVLIEKFLTYVAAFAVTFFVLGGSMYAFLRAVIDFFVSNA